MTAGDLGAHGFGFEQHDDRALAEAMEEEALSAQGFVTPRCARSTGNPVEDELHC
jgi:hypothetical protein